MKWHALSSSEDLIDRHSMMQDISSARCIGGTKKEALILPKKMEEGARLGEQRETS